MKHTLTKLIEQSGSRLKLSSEERARVAGALREYMATKPMAAKKTRAPLPSPYVHTIGKRSAVALLVLALLLSGGTSYAAEAALPGDVLYPVKVSVNEEVRAALLVSTEERLKWDSARAERRLEEAAALATRGTLTADARNEIAMRFAAHAERVAAEVALLDVEDADLASSVATNFSATLEAHEEILDDLDDHKEIRDKVREEVRRIASRSVAVAPEEVSTMALRATDVTTSRTPAEKRSVERALSRANTQLSETRVRYERVKRSLNAETDTRVQAELEAIATLIQEGQHQEAQGRAQKLAVYLKTASRLKIEIEVEDEEDKGIRRGDSRDNDKDEDEGGDDDGDEEKSKKWDVRKDRIRVRF